MCVLSFFFFLFKQLPLQATWYNTCCSMVFIIDVGRYFGVVNVVH